MSVTALAEQVGEHPGELYLELTTDAIAHAIATARLGTPHPCVAPGPAPRDEQAAQAATAAAGQELVRRGLATGSGALRPDFAAALATLTRPQTECYGWIKRTGGDDAAVLAAASGGAAVLARRTGDLVRLSPVHPGTLVAQVVAELPRHADGHGYPMVVREADFAAAAVGTQPEVAALRQLVALPRLGCAQLYVARGGRGIRRRRVQQPLTVLDTAVAGRWCTFSEQRDRGERWIVATPAYQDWLVARLTELAAALPGAGRGR